MKNENYIHKLLTQFAADPAALTALEIYDGKQIRKIGYRQLAEDCLAAAGYFAEKGIRRQNIALIGANSYLWLVGFLGITASGNTAVLLNPDLPAELLREQCAVTETSVVCGDRKEIPALSEEIAMFPLEEIRGSIPVQPELLAAPGEQDICVMMFTSGTTGTGKAVMLTCENLAACICGGEDVFSEPGIRKILTVLPMFHISGLRGTLAMLYRHKTVCLGRGPMYLFKDLPVLEPDYAPLVPMMAESIAKRMKIAGDRDSWKSFLGGNLNRLFVGGASVPVAVCRYLMEQGFTLDSGYAMTETCGVGTWSEWREERYGTIGKLTEGIQCRIEDGELLFKGPAVMAGYYGDPEETARVLKDGWLRTGDLGYCDEDGYYYLTGRKKNLMVFSNGKKVSPEEIEGELSRCGDIQECLIFGEKDAVCAEIYSKNRTAVEKWMKDYNERMPLYRQVRKVIYRDAPLEKTASGKIKRRKGAL